MAAVVTDRERDPYAYDRHVILYYKNPDSWPPNSNPDPLVKRALHIHLESPQEQNDPQVVWWNHQPWHPGVCGVLTRSYVYVSAQSDTFLNLIHTFKKEIAHPQLNNKISVTACSHLGWHKYPGDVLIYCRGPLLNIIGHWYYYVSPDGVPDILDQHIAKGEILQRLPGAQMVRSVGKVEGTVIQNEDDVTQYEGDLGLSDSKEDSNKGEDILKASSVIGGVAVAFAVYALARAYKSYRRW